MNIYASGDNVIYGQIGHFLIIASFIAAAASSVAYYMGVRTASISGDAASWIQNARRWFMLHAVSTIGIAAILILMIQQHVFDYKYVWQHSSTALPFKYLLSAFWEGQEGSTLLWMFWHAILGIVLMFSARKWEAPVMVFIALAQVMLASMLLGIYIPVPDLSLDLNPFFFAFEWSEYRVGSNPFILVKDAMSHLPVFQMNPDYVFEDGNGLNPLLQNYWMVIHPPTLFLGFAATTVPFAFALASLWTRNYQDWLKPGLNWTLFALLILGTGILMGGAWAYESLSFGGFWAWDPVENASLVPWLMLAAGLHTLMAFKHRGYSLGATYLFLIAAFLLILYSSFLTKSGILGDSSVHSFTDMGMSAQLVIMIAVFLIPAIWLLATRYKHLPSKKQEEKISSREFWLFIGSLIFLVSALHIIIFTSFPVFNNLFGTNYAPPGEDHYNSVEIWVAILLAIVVAISQFFSYKQTEVPAVLKKLGLILLVSVLLSIPVLISFSLWRADYLLLTLSGIFALVGNLWYIFSGIKGRLYHAGGSVTHIGFALFVLGILISQGRQHVVSLNKFGINYGENFSDDEIAENVLLYINEPQMMSGYRVTYIGDTVVAPNIHFKVRYEKLDERGNVKQSFVLDPNVQINQKMGNVANPSTRRAFNKDLFTHITSAPLKEDGSPADSILTETHKLSIGDTMFISRGFAIFERVYPDSSAEGLGPSDIMIAADLRVFTADSSYITTPKYLIKDLIATSIPSKTERPQATITLTRILPDENQLEFVVEQKMNKYIIMKAIIFPWMNLLWAGCLVMIIGISMSLRKRYLEKSKA
jgi:cytochrome c-type biogenesis protein CcmF